MDSKNCKEKIIFSQRTAANCLIIFINNHRLLNFIQLVVFFIFLPFYLAQWCIELGVCQSRYPEAGSFDKILIPSIRSYKMQV